MQSVASCDIKMTRENRAPTSFNQMKRLVSPPLLAESSMPCLESGRDTLNEFRGKKLCEVSAGKVTHSMDRTICSMFSCSSNICGVSCRLSMWP